MNCTKILSTALLLGLVFAGGSEGSGAPFDRPAKTSAVWAGNHGGAGTNDPDTHPPTTKFKLAGGAPGGHDSGDPRKYKDSDLKQMLLADRGGGNSGSLTGGPKNSTRHS